MEEYVEAVLMYAGILTGLLSVPLVYVLYTVAQQMRQRLLEQQEASQSLLIQSDQVDTEPEHPEV